jgi:hypothetical protein
MLKPVKYQNVLRGVLEKNQYHQEPSPAKKRTPTM